MEAGPMSRGTCAGFEIHSSLPFSVLRDGGGQPLHVEARARLAPEGEVVAVWRPRPGNPFHGRLLERDGTFAFWASDAGWFFIEPDPGRITVADDAEPVLRELRLFGIPAAVCAFAAGDLPLHASAVEINGQGVLFAAPSMHGKTTLAAGFAAQGHRLLAEDTVRCTTGPEAQVYPGPAVVRLRADVAGRLDIPGAGALQVEMEEGRTALAFDRERRGDGDAIPLRAIVFLQASETAISLEPVPSSDAARDLFALAFRIPTAASRQACFTRAVDLAGHVAAYRLDRPMTIASLPDVVAAIEELVDR